MDDADRSETDSSAFIPIFVISLPDCTDRRERIARHLNDLSLPFEFVDAVDGRDDLPADCESLVDRDRTASTPGGPLSDPEIACSLSHLQACRRMADLGIPWALVLEDDAIPSPDLPGYLRSRHFEAFDLVSLFYSKTYVHPRSGARTPLEGYRSFPCEPGVPVRGACAYVISEAGARHLLAKALPVASVADWPDCTETFKAGKRWHLVHPRLVEHKRRHEDRETSIIGRGRNRRKRRFLGVYVPPFAKIAASCKAKIDYRARGLRKLDWGNAT
ncbi:MAG: glycosyltransferase family 25 protein [Boseongicola sp.]|nr:glycosyltransferase family 25 protein [Boseongicola sp.]